MNKMHFYLSLAITNIKKNSKFYLPYLLTFMGTVAMYYMIHAISLNKALPGGDSMRQMMGLGIYIMAIFAVIFLFYTNSFLIKRRKREFGLFQILGMEKKHIAKVLFCESIMIFMIGILGGMALGILFQKFLLMLLLRIARFDVAIAFWIEARSLYAAFILFGVIFIVTYLFNVFQMAKTKTVDLLKGDHIGEREPKTKWIMAILGAASLGTGYVLALNVKNPLEALNMFFVAVLLVVVGTYFLFIAGSIAVLKALRANRRFYYKTTHFTAVSGLLYRMKQNAAGLATICILSTMVLVTVSTTVCLYAGVEDALHTRYHHDITVLKRDVDISWDSTNLEKKVIRNLEKHCEIEEYQGYRRFYLNVMLQNGEVQILENGVYSPSMHQVYIFTAGDYEKISGEKPDLAPGEVYVYDYNAAMPEKFHLMSQEFRVKKYLKEMDAFDEAVAMAANIHCVVVADDETASQIKEEYQAQCPDFMGGQCVYEMNFDVKGSVAEKIKAADTVSNKMKEEISSVECREANREDFYAIYGGFLFLGMFLGLVFVMATTLIIYYKQISEGYDDKVRFEIMQKVGMSQKEVKASIRSQVILVFFLPLVMAAIHVCVAFPMMKKLLGVLNMSNPEPFLWCLLATIGVFTLLYIIVYSMTSKIYYKIVE
ncbi:MAG: ABC transporter permease [Lachnospiraceae bacterium]|nr:ABC transporter permease [Lachnospiraceae bacterium]